MNNFYMEYPKRLVPFTKEDFAKLEEGDSVFISYFLVYQKGVILKKTPTRVRVRFRNEGGGTRETWRHYYETFHGPPTGREIDISKVTISALVDGYVKRPYNSEGRRALNDLIQSRRHFPFVVYDGSFGDMSLEAIRTGLDEWKRRTDNLGEEDAIERLLRGIGEIVEDIKEGRVGL